MKNLFDFATKELSQDAFICWLVANKDEPEVKDCAEEFFNHIFSIANVDYKASDMSDVEIFQQCNHMDIVIDFVANNIKRTLVIEDKTNSGEHNQLVVYDKTIAKWKTAKNIVRIFYKTDYMFDDERARVQYKDGTHVSDWHIFEFKDINEIFSKYKNSKNLILKDYANHVCDLYDDLSNDELPKNDDRVKKWEGFFRNYLEKGIAGVTEKWSYCTRYNYAVLGFRVKNKGSSFPYAEIRSRDLVNGKFNARILTYGCDNLDKAKLANIVAKYCVGDSLLVAHANPDKQFAKTKEVEFSNKEELTSIVKKFLETYKKIIYEYYK